MDCQASWTQYPWCATSLPYRSPFSYSSFSRCFAICDETFQDCRTTDYMTQCIRQKDSVGLVSDDLGPSSWRLTPRSTNTKAPSWSLSPYVASDALYIHWHSQIVRLRLLRAAVWHPQIANSLCPVCLIISYLSFLLLLLWSLIQILF